MAVAEAVFTQLLAFGIFELLKIRLKTIIMILQIFLLQSIEIHLLENLSF